MDPHHRKIDLQAPADLLYLRANILLSAQEKFDLAIPPSAATTTENGPDTFRPQVQQLVQDYITQTFSLALPSLAVNGLDADPSVLDAKTSSDAMEDESHYEAYDPRLGEKLRTLHRQLEWEHTRVAELRREAPGAAARAYVERLEREREGERRTGREVEGEVGGVREGEEGLEGAVVQRVEEVEKMWGKGVEGLVELGKVTEVVARMERARKAAEVVEGM
ncbi:MAG: hypothetical protein LQ338_007756 [Usnochroma carphineum]|nr:MAG: hypothetical protein LQ338_007756 [Usnochroma carphineum]